MPEQPAESLRRQALPTTSHGAGVSGSGGAGSRAGSARSGSARAGAAPRRSAPPRKGEVTAGRILDAAEALFSERGYDGTTLRDVAGRVGLRIPSLYNHFASKDALYAAVLERGIGPVVALLADLTRAPAEVRSDPRSVVEPVMALLARQPHLPRLVLHETLAGGQRLTPMLREWMAPAFARAQELVQERDAARRWAPEQVSLLVLAMYHAVIGYFASAPLYRELTGIELLSEPMVSRQIELLREMVEALLPSPGPAPAPDR
jgi:TetR/AcrR family transcriptional regulator